ncbi:MAG: protein translocase subunit SecF [Micromonosporaceae bacterium]
MSDQLEPETTEERSGTLRNIANRLYRGEAGIDVVGNRKIFYSVAAGILLIAILSLTFRGLTLGVEFKGGNTFEVPSSVGTLDEASDAVGRAGAEVVHAQRVGGTVSTYRVQTAPLDADEALRIKQKVADELNIPVGDVNDNAVSASWGSQITKKALQGLAMFLVAVVIYLIFVFREWRMAVAALAALAQNLALTVAVYALVGFEVSPSTVIGFLTILGFALYDVVVVFDKVRENTQGITGNPNRTYGEAANLAVNQTLMRSINTAVVALLPVGGLLFIGAGLLGAGTLKDLGLVLFVGMLAAVYSSIFFATPVLVDLKEQEPRYKLHKQRVLARRAGALTERKPAKVAPRAADAEAPEPAPTGVLTTTGSRAGGRPGGGGGGARKRPGGKPGGAKSGGRGGSKRR